MPLPEKRRNTKTKASKQKEEMAADSTLALHAGKQQNEPSEGANGHAISLLLTSELPHKDALV
jgi:hypothetical protein